MSDCDVLAILALLRSAGAEVWIAGDWGIDALVGAHLDWRPVRFVLTDAGGRQIDLHPLLFAPDGSARQASMDLGRFSQLRRAFGIATHF
jgi:lincosamide nucleotidyltransferase A/C/D/E